MKENFQSSPYEKEIILSEEEAENLAEELKTKLKEGEKPNANQIKKLIGGLGDKRGLIRRTFSECLAEIGQASLPELQKALLKSKNVIVRRAAAKTLKLVGDPKALNDLLFALKNDPDPVVQGSSAGAIAIFGREAVQPLLEVLKDPKSSSMQCGLASWGLAFVGAEASEDIKKAAKSKYPSVRAAAIAAMGEQIQSLNDKNSINVLIDSLNDSSTEVQIEAIKLMGSLDQINWNINLIAEKLNDKNAEIRKQASLAIMKLNAKEEIIKLQERLSIEKNDNVIEVIKLSIKKLISI